MIFSETLSQYIKELSKPKYEPASKEEEKELVLQLRSGSLVARNELIERHLRFVMYLLRDYKIPSQVDPMDIIQEGNMGLIEGINKFDPSFECRVFTYVRHYILWYIGRTLSLYSKTNQYYVMPDDFNFDNIEAEEIVNDDQVKVKAYEDIVKSLEKIHSLTKEELTIIKLRFGLEFPYKCYTLKEIALLMHTDSERIRQIKNLALEKIKLSHSLKNLMEV